MYDKLSKNKYVCEHKKDHKWKFVACILGEIWEKWFPPFFGYGKWMIFIAFLLSKLMEALIKKQKTSMQHVKNV